MKVFFLDRRGPVDYGELDSAVVVALNETAARHLINKSRTFSDERHWFSPDYAEVRELGVAHGTEEEIVVLNHREG